MKKIKALLISAACLALSFTVQGQDTCPEIPRSINTQELTDFDAAALYSQIKNAKKAFEVAMTDPYKFPFSTAQMRKMAAFVVGYYVFRTVVFEKIDTALKSSFPIRDPGLCGKDGYNLFIKSMDLFAGKLAWDRLGDEVKALNRFIDAWAGYFYDQTMENAQKAYDSVSSMLQPVA